MRPVPPGGANQEIGPPPDWDDAYGPAPGPVPVRVTPDGKLIVSCWKPSVHELAALVDGGVLQITIHGDYPRAMQIGVEIEPEPVRSVQ